MAENLVEMLQTAVSATFAGDVAKHLGESSVISSVTTLLSAAAPAVFAFLKRHLAQNRLDAGGFAGLLAGQRDNLQAQLDDRFTGALGFASPACCGR